VIEKKKIDRC